MRSTTASCWSLLKPSRPGDITWRAASIKFLCLQITKTSNVSWTRKAWVLGRSGGHKSCQGTTSGLIINRAKLMELLMPCLDTPSRVLRKKRLSKPRIQRSCTDCSPRWLEYQDWACENSRCCPPWTKCSSVGQLSYYSWLVLGYHSK